MGESNMGGTPEHTISQSSEMTSVADPFFGQTHTSDHHSRQESGDSGLGESSEQNFFFFFVFPLHFGVFFFSGSVRKAWLYCVIIT